LTASRFQGGAGIENAARAPEILASIEEAIVEFEARYQVAAQDSLVKSLDLGAEFVVTPIEDALAVSIASPVISPDLLEVMQATTADLVTNVADEVRREITKEVRLGVGGVNRPFEVQERIAKTLRSTREGGSRRGIANRAEKITRTEMNRTFSIANDEALKDVKEVIPDLKKQWITAGDNRVSAGPNATGVRRSPRNHAAMEGEIRPVDQRFSNGLRFPLDPFGPPEQVVDCRCKSVAFREEWVTPEELQGMVTGA